MEGQLLDIVHVPARDPRTLLQRLKEEEWIWENPAPPNVSVALLLWEGGTWAGWEHKVLLRLQTRAERSSHAAQHQIPPPNYFTHHKPVQKMACPVDCQILRHRTQLGLADAVLFEPTTTYGMDAWAENPPQLPEKFPNQLFLGYHYETPEYFPLLAEKPFLDALDGMLSYKQDAFLQMSFYCPFGGGDLEMLLAPPPEKKDPSKLVVFMASNCANGGARRRYEYVRELMKYIHVDSYGICLHNQDTPQPHHMRQKRDMSHGEVMFERMRLISQYKFVLAFENTEREDDYVTEKVWTTWLAGSVPVYWGAPTIREWLPGDDCIIEALHFSSPKDLAEYLKKVANDDRLYAKYFEWKKKPLREGFMLLYNNCAVNADCRLCKKIAHYKKDWPQTVRPLNPCHALQFAGENDGVEIPDSPTLRLTETYTLVAWIQLQDFGYGARIIDKNREGEIAGFNLDVLSDWGKPHLRLCAAGACYQSHTTLHLNRWSHVAASFSLPQKRLALYIDGVLDSEHGISQPTLAPPLPMRFGMPAVSPHGVPSYTSFRGFLDSVSIWNISLSGEEIKRLMYARPARDAPGLVGYYPFDDVTGTQVVDMSSCGNHGKLLGGALWIASCTKPLLGLSDPHSSRQPQSLTIGSLLPSQNFPIEYMLVLPPFICGFICVSLLIYYYVRMRFSRARRTTSASSLLKANTTQLL